MNHALGRNSPTTQESKGWWNYYTIQLRKSVASYKLGVTFSFRDLTIKRGDLVVLLQKVDEDWYIGELSGKQGYVPANFVEV